MYNIFHRSFPSSRMLSYRIIADAEYIAEYINRTEAWNFDDLVMGAAIFTFTFYL